MVWLFAGLVVVGLIAFVSKGSSAYNKAERELQVMTRNHPEAFATFKFMFDEREYKGVSGNINPVAVHKDFKAFLGLYNLDPFTPAREAFVDTQARCREERERMTPEEKDAHWNRAFGK